MRETCCRKVVARDWIINMWLIYFLFCLAYCAQLILENKCFFSPYFAWCMPKPNIRETMSDKFWWFYVELWWMDMPENSLSHMQFTNLMSYCWPLQKQSLNFFLFYWVIQAGWLTPLTFAWHHLSPLAAFTSGAYFLHNGRRWQWICKF